VALDRPLRQTIEFDNPLAEELVIEAIQLTPPMRATGATTRIAPGGRGSFTFEIGEPRRLGLYEGTILVRFRGDALAPLQFDVSGTFVGPVEIAPYAAVFLVAERGATDAAALEILNHRAEPLPRPTIVGASPRYRARVEEVEAGRRYRLVVEMTGEGAEGRQTDTLVLATGVPEVGELAVQVNSLLRERVYHFPDEVSFGVLPESQVRDPAVAPRLAQTVMVFRKGQPGFEIAVTSSLDFVRVLAERGPEGDRWQLTLELDPERTPRGEFRGRLVVTTNDAEFPRLEVPMIGGVEGPGGAPR
jgi:hypothetical protein